MFLCALVVCSFLLVSCFLLYACITMGLSINPVDGRSVCFQIRDIMNEAAVKICEQVFCIDIHFHFSWE